MTDKVAHALGVQHHCPPHAMSVGQDRRSPSQDMEIPFLVPSLLVEVVFFQEWEGENDDA